MYSNFELLDFIKGEVDFVLLNVGDKTQQEFLNDDILCQAVVRNLEIIGKAAKKIDPDFKSEHPQIEWRKIAGTRDRLIHDYFGIDYEILWEIIQYRLPDLKNYIEDLLNGQ